METLKTILSHFNLDNAVLAVPVLIIIAMLANLITKRIVSRGLTKMLSYFPKSGLRRNSTFLSLASRLANIVPALILIGGVQVISEIPAGVRKLVVNACSAFIIFMLAIAAARVVDLLEMAYSRSASAANKPIKGYLQLLKIIIIAVSTILAVAVFIDRNPLILLSGLGAMAAVLMLIFQDTILSLVASVQLGSDDIIRIGDWIEMPELNADGDVVEITLHTVKVSNWDKTITTLPVRSLITQSFKNWRGMSEAGGRRIKRSLFLDQRSIRFLEEDEIKRLEDFVLINDYLQEKRVELDNWNAKLEALNAKPINERRITNLGTFRAYVNQYLKNLPTINHDMTLLVRQLQPGASGLPLEIYCFTNDIRWAAYENIQSDIFDHLLAILPSFGLRIFQQCSDISGMHPEQAMGFQEATQ